MDFDNAEGMVFRPPSEANSFILRITIGCSHNACTFCGMYRDVKFRVRSMEEITSQIILASQVYPDLRRVFLADGNALVLDNAKLLSILSLLRGKFPKLARVGCYAGPKDIIRKTPAELTALRQAGLHIIYLGIESGDDEVLSYVNKGASSADMISAGKQVLAAGIKLSAMIILGLGGREKSEQHALNTARVVSETNPTMLSALTLMLHENTPLRQAAERGEFTPLSPFEHVQELKNIIANTAMDNPCIFRSNHVSNFAPLAGTLPQDKERLLVTLDGMIDKLKYKNRPTFNDDGLF